MDIDQAWHHSEAVPVGEFAVDVSVDGGDGAELFTNEATEGRVVGRASGDEQKRPGGLLRHELRNDLLAMTALGGEEDDQGVGALPGVEGSASHRRLQSQGPGRVVVTRAAHLLRSLDHGGLGLDQHAEEAENDNGQKYPPEMAAIPLSE